MYVGKFMMWDLGNLWGEGSKSSVAPPMASSYLAVMHEIHVLLVDHEPESLMTTGRDLECCQYRGRQNLTDLP